MQTAVRMRKFSFIISDVAIPAGRTKIDLISVYDASSLIASLFELSNRKKHLGRTLALSGCKISVQEMASTLTRKLCTMEFKDSLVNSTYFNQFLKITSTTRAQPGGERGEPPPPKPKNCRRKMVLFPKALFLVTNFRKNKN